MSRLGAEFTFRRRVGLTNGFIGDSAEQGTGFAQQSDIVLHADVATSLEVLHTHVPSRGSRVGSGDDSENLLERELVARDRQRTGVAEAVLLLGLDEEPPEDRMVKVRRADDESPAAGPDADRDVSGGNIGRRS